MTSTNYDNLQTKAKDYVEDVEDVATASLAVETAEKDVEQTKAALDLACDKVDAIAQESTNLESEATDANALFTSLTNERGPLVTKLGSKHTGLDPVANPPTGTAMDPGSDFITDPDANFVLATIGSGLEQDLQNAERKIDNADLKITLAAAPGGIAGYNDDLSIIEKYNDLIDDSTPTTPATNTLPGPMRKAILDKIYDVRIRIAFLEDKIEEITAQRAAVLAVNPSQDVSSYTQSITDHNTQIGYLKADGNDASAAFAADAPTIEALNVVVDLTVKPDVDLAQLEAALAAQDQTIADIVSKINQVNTIVATTKTQREQYVADRERLTAERDEAANRLQDIEGNPTGGVGTDDAAFNTVAPYNAAPYLTAPLLELVDGTAGFGAQHSQLRALKFQAGFATIKKDSADAEKAYFDTVKATRQTAYNDPVIGAVKSLSDANVTLGSAESALALTKGQLDALIETQKNIEIDAAALLLEEFLVNGSAIVSSAPTVNDATRTKIAMTCPNSKVRSFVDVVNAAYADEDAYVALRAQIAADPVGSFFDVINDPCFNVLPADELAALRAAIKDGFAARASELFALYFPSGASTSSGSSNAWVVAIVGIVALIAVVLIAMYVA